MKESRDFLEPITGSVKRNKFATVDIESKDGDSQDAGFTCPFLIGVYDPERRIYNEFRNEPHLAKREWSKRAASPGGCVDKTLSYLLSSVFRGYTFYAHNGGAFDHLFWLEWLKQHNDEYGFEVIPVQSSIQAIKVWRIPEDPDDPIKDRWTFLDSLKLFPKSLAEMLKTFDLPGKVTHDLNMHEDDPHWSVYLKQDCIGLAEGLLKIHDLVENKLEGEVGMTAPSTSMKIFRRRYLGRKGSVKRIARYAHWQDCENKEKCSGCAHSWVRMGYYGGRTELFRTYGEGLHYYDINSSYAASMHEDMPVGDRTVTDHLDWRMAERNAGFVECLVEIPAECEIPPLPHRSKTTGKLTFPTGKFSGIWSTKELELLSDPLVKGRILSVKKVVWFGLRPVFQEMIEALWGFRQKCLTGCTTKGCKGCNPAFDEGLSAMAKIFINACYGKFGMKQERTSIVFSEFKDKEHCFLCQEPLIDLKQEHSHKGVKIAGGLCKACEGSKPANDEYGDVWYQKKQVEASYIIPHIAAHITALARVRIWRFMQKVILAGGHVYYTDTDSCLTNISMPSSQELGAFKDEYPGLELRGYFLQPKVYMLETMDGSPFPKEHLKECKGQEDGSCKGCVTSKVTMKGFPKHLRTKENLERLQNKEELSYPNLEKIRTLASNSFRRGPLMRLVKKSFKSDYDKRVMNDDNVTTRAIVLDESGEWSHPLSEVDNFPLEEVLVCSRSEPRSLAEREAG